MNQKSKSGFYERIQENEDLHIEYAQFAENEMKSDSLLNNFLSKIGFQYSSLDLRILRNIYNSSLRNIS